MSATIRIDNDWGSGYCATVLLTNNGTTATNDWTVAVDLKGAQLYDHWNSNHSISGTILTQTSLVYNGTIQPSAGIVPLSSSPGFCANGTQRPVLVSVTGTAPDCRTYYYDADGDGYGNSASSIYTCSTAPANYVAVGGDCCDSDNQTYPGQASYFAAPNACASYDYDCNGSASPKSNGPTGCFETPRTCVLNATQTGCDQIPTTPLPAECNGIFDSFGTAACGQTWYISIKGCGFGWVVGTGTPHCSTFGNGGPGGVQACK